MTGKKRQEIIPTEIYCCKCKHKIFGKPYIVNGKIYCCICGRRLELGMLGNIVEQGYGGLRVNG